MKFSPTALAAALLLPACSDPRPEIKNFGSDTMLEIAGAWSEAYEQVRPQVVVSVSGGGSGTGISGIINGTVDIANCSRPMHEEEVAAADKAGHHPVQHKVGYDGIAIYVHKENPLAAISFDQLRQIFGKDGKVTRWSQLGVQLPPGNSDEIVVVSRQNNGGTYEYFREDVLGKGNFRLGTRDMSGSKDVVDLVSRTPGAIGYSGLAYATAAIKVLPVARADGEAPVLPSIDTVLDHSYPLSRPLFMYTIGEPPAAGGDVAQLSPEAQKQAEIAAYLQWIVSDAGQRILQQNGYPPLRKL